ncbi:MAG: bifunctional precorrin-2 dehydrogenase/sirohydrochlorin ferrochelatase [Cyclobacteriaceae bacterium]
MAEQTQSKNTLFPVFLKLETLQLLIVGGGNIGLEKLEAVLVNSPETHIKIVAREFIGEVRRLASGHPNVSLVEKEFDPADLDGMELVILATNDNALNAEIKKLTRERKLLCNVADKPDLCDFYLGSIVQKGDLKIAISTNGKSPTVAKRIKEFLNEEIPETIQEVLDNMGAIRDRLKGDFEHKVKSLNEVTKGWLGSGK